MEKHGLGTPATRADIIEKLVSSDTIHRQGNSMHPTGKGKQLIELAAPQFRSPDLTARWKLNWNASLVGKGNRGRFWIVSDPWRKSWCLR